MSVAQLTRQELGTFAAVSHLLGLVPVTQACAIAAKVSEGNCAAWGTTYKDESIDPVSFDNIEDEALRCLADHSRMAKVVFPFAYNMIANDGTAFYGFHECDGDDEDFKRVQHIGEKVSEWIDAKRISEDSKPIARSKERETAEIEAWESARLACGNLQAVKANLERYRKTRAGQVSALNHLETRVDELVRDFERALSRAINASVVANAWEAERKEVV